MNKLDWKAFKPFFHSSWHKEMKGIIESPEVWEIYQQLKKEDKKITPDSKDTFKAFQMDLDYLSVFMMGMSPYPQIDMNTRRANGLAFDCRSYGGVSPSLSKLYDAWEDDCYNGLNLNYDKTGVSLEYLVNQGVMLANASLTCLKDEPKSHSDLWTPFWVKVFDKIFYNRELIFILLGTDAQVFENCCTDKHKVLKAEHPAAASYQKRAMNHNQVFSNANSILRYRGKYTISWLLDSDVPF